MITSETPSSRFRLSLRAIIKDRVSGLTGVRKLQPEEPMNLVESIHTNDVEVGGQRQIHETDKFK